MGFNGKKPWDYHGLFLYKFLSFTVEFPWDFTNSDIVGFNPTKHENMGGNQLSEEKTQLVPAGFQPQQSFFWGFHGGSPKWMVY